MTRETDKQEYVWQKRQHVAGKRVAPEASATVSKAGAIMTCGCVVLPSPSGDLSLQMIV